MWLMEPHICQRTVLTLVGKAETSGGSRSSELSVASRLRISLFVGATPQIWFSSTPQPASLCPLRSWKEVVVKLLQMQQGCVIIRACCVLLLAGGGTDGGPSARVGSSGRGPSHRR